MSSALARNNRPEEEHERKEKPRRDPGLSWRPEDKDIEEDPRLRRASDCVEGGPLLNWLLWDEGRRRSKKAYMRQPEIKTILASCKKVNWKIVTLSLSHSPPVEEGLR